MIIPITAPIITMSNGRLPVPKNPSARLANRPAWGAASSLPPIPPGVLSWSNCRIGAITSDATATPIICIICCLYGVAPTICPVLRSLQTSPDVQAAQHTIAATPSVATIPSVPEKPKTYKRPPVNNTAVMVMPDTGELEFPTNPTI